MILTRGNRSIGIATSLTVTSSTTNPTCSGRKILPRPPWCWTGDLPHDVWYCRNYCYPATHRMVCDTAETTVILRHTAWSVALPKLLLSCDTPHDLWDCRNYFYLAKHRMVCGTAETTVILRQTAWSVVLHKLLLSWSFFRGVLQLFDASFWFETFLSYSMILTWRQAT